MLARARADMSVVERLHRGPSRLFAACEGRENSCVYFVDDLVRVVFDTLLPHTRREALRTCQKSADIFHHFFAPGSVFSRLLFCSYVSEGEKAKNERKIVNNLLN